MSTTDTAPRPGESGIRGASTVGGVRASWWNALFSLIVSVCAAHVAAGVALVTVAELTGDVAELPGPRLVLGGLTGLVSLVVQGRMIPWLRVGLGGGISSVPLAASSVVAGLVVWAALLPTGAGVLPLVSALTLVGCAAVPPVRRAAFVVAVVLGVLAWVWADASVRIPVVVILTVAYPYLVYASVWAWDVVVRLDAARATEADLAVTRERLRFAADLHDIQGHSLQVIALKAELAERLLEARPEAAAEQISEVRGEAADALAQTRELARGYRATGIEDELANARDVLAVAGFDCSTEIVELPDDAAVRSLFGRVLREATTNVLRHADPGPVEIETGRHRDESGCRDVWRLEVVNQATIPFVPAIEEGQAGGPAGAGLVGLAERVEALGGRLTTRVCDGTGPSRFVLTVAMPVGRRAGSSS